MVYQQRRRWMEDELGMTFGPTDGNGAGATTEEPTHDGDEGGDA
jgi:hypothetical protein